MYAYVAETPKHVDFLMGCDVLDFLGVDVDRRGMRAIFSSMGIVAQLSRVDDNNRRLQTKPLTQPHCTQHVLGV